MNFPLRTALAASYQIWCAVFTFSLVSGYVLVSLSDFCSDPLVVQKHVV